MNKIPLHRLASTILIESKLIWITPTPHTTLFMNFPQQKSRFIKLLLIILIWSASRTASYSQEPPALQIGSKESLQETHAQRDARMKWWREARFGMFIHWGLYSVGGGKWNGQDSGSICSWMQSRLCVSPNDYATLQSGFTAKNYDPRAWAKLAKSAGMKYAVLTSKHHEGFCLYDSKYTDYDVMNTPAKRDLLKGYFKAFRAEGLKTGLYYSLFDWHHPHYPVKGDEYHPMRGNDEFLKQHRSTKKYIDYLHAQAREIATNYGPLDIMWWDYSYGKMDHNVWRAKKITNMMRSLQPGIVMNNRLHVGVLNPNGDFSTPEQYIPSTGTGSDWEACMTMNTTWGYKPHDHDYKSSKNLIHQLIEVVSKGGNYLLNVGPKPDGTIPKEQVERLQDIGKWMAIHSESIYGTQASPFPRVLPWGYCTRKSLPDGNTRLYIHVLNRLKKNVITLPPIKNKPISAHYLSATGSPKLALRALDQGISITLPSKPANQNAEVIVLDIQGTPEVLQDLALADDAGVINLSAKEAVLHGKTIKYNSTSRSLGTWLDTNDSISWALRTGSKARKYKISVNYGLPHGHGGSVQITCGDHTVSFKSTPTGGWFKYKPMLVGEIDLKANTQYKLVVKTID
ncbi:MAG: alpha-L-fucosidase, partial [Akkermansiaceae bacterium]